MLSTILYTRHPSAQRGRGNSPADCCPPASASPTLGFLAPATLWERGPRESGSQSRHPLQTSPGGGVTRDTGYRCASSDPTRPIKLEVLSVGPRSLSCSKPACGLRENRRSVMWEFKTLRGDLIFEVRDGPSRDLCPTETVRTVFCLRAGVQVPMEKIAALSEEENDLPKVPRPQRGTAGPGRRVPTLTRQQMPSLQPARS